MDRMTANWDAIGAFGELVGALAVVLTLLYLAKQISAANRATRAQSFRDVSAQFTELHALVATTPSLALALHKLDNGEALLPAEQKQVQATLQLQFIAWSNFYLQATELNQQERIQTIKQGMASAMSKPYMWDYWEIHRPLVSQEFARFVESIRVRS